MIRVSERQFALFQNPGKSPRKAREFLPENILESQICAYLRYRGWHVSRQHSGTFRTLGRPSRVITVGEPGITDWRSERAPPGGKPGHVEMFYIEIKAPKKTPDPDQRRWARDRKRLGWMVVWFNEFDKFVAWYEETWGARGES